jgi:protein TonB
LSRLTGAVLLLVVTTPLAAQKVANGIDIVDATLVDEQPVRESGRSLRYPEMLRRAGIEGHVVLEFVVDANGRPDTATFYVVESTNRAFEGAARDFIRLSRFRPAQWGGRDTAVRVHQKVVFKQSEG